MLPCMPARRVASSGLALALLAWSCSSPPPVAEEKPKRKSWEDQSQWTPSSGTSADPSVDERARAIEDKWEQVRQTSDAAERERLANEALQETRALADQPSGQ